MKNNLWWGRERPAQSMLQTQRPQKDTRSGTANAHSFISFSGPFALLFCGHKSRGGTGIQDWFLQEGAWSAGSEMPPGFCWLILMVATVPSAFLSAPLLRIALKRRGSPCSKRCCVSTPSAPFPQHWITQLEIMLLPVTSKPSGASAKVNTGSSQFH